MGRMWWKEGGAMTLARDTWKNEHHQGQDLHLGLTGAQVPASRKGPSSVGARWLRPSQPGPPTWGP